MTVYERLGASRVINASGRMTALGGALLSDAVVDAMAQAAMTYVDIADLKRRAGRRIAELCAAPDAMVTTGAASGIVTMVAAVIAGTDPVRIDALPNASWEPRDIAIQAGHQVDFGGSVSQMIRMGGGRPLPVGAVNAVTAAQMRSALERDVSAVLFVQSHHTVQKGMLSLPEVIELAHDAGVPVLVDAAAEEDWGRYVHMGSDLVAYSGGKAFEGPASGFVVGRTDLIEACRAQESGVCRPMKVGKETIAGLMQALEEYAERDDRQRRRRWNDAIAVLYDGLRDLGELRLEVQPDEAGRAISRLAVRLAPDVTAFSLGDLVADLRSGVPRIEVRAHHLNEGTVHVDPRPLGNGDAQAVVERIRQIVQARRSGAGQTR